MAKSGGGPLANWIKSAKGTESSLAQLARELQQWKSSADVESIEALPAVRETFVRLETAFRDLSESTAAYLSEVGSGQVRDLESYPQRLAEALRASGLEPVGDPARPIIDGLVFVEFLADGPTLKVNERTMSDLRLASVVAEVRSTRDRLRREISQPGDFILELDQAYTEELALISGSPGTQIHIRAIHLRLLLNRQSRGFFGNPKASNFKEYPLEVFRGDLFLLLSAAAPTPPGRLVRVAAGSDTKGALFMMIPHLGRPGYVGRLWFEGSST